MNVNLCQICDIQQYFYNSFLTNVFWIYFRFFQHHTDATEVKALGCVWFLFDLQPLGVFVSPLLGDSLFGYFLFCFVVTLICLLVFLHVVFLISFSCNLFFPLSLITSRVY